MDNPQNKKQMTKNNNHSPNNINNSPINDDKYFLNDTNSQNSNNKNSLNNTQIQNISLKLYQTLPLNYCDPINSISLTDDFLIYGSMIGKVLLYEIKTKKEFKICESAHECIMGTSLQNKIDEKNNKEMHFAAVGDEYIISIKFEKGDILIKNIFNYEQRAMHLEYCKNSFQLLNGNILLILLLIPPANNDEPIRNYNCKFYLNYFSDKKLKTKCKEGIIDISNYVVPFDFRENIFLFLEYLSKDERAICFYYFLYQETEDNVIDKCYKNTIMVINDNKFGKVSFLKIMKNNLVLLVRNENIIEIYEVKEKEKMKIISTYCNEGGEINGINFYKSKENKNNSEIFYIVFFDINLNLVELCYNYYDGIGKINTNISVNLEKDEVIDYNYIFKGLFNFDFPYYVANSEHYIALTTDENCFLFQKN